MCQFASWKEDKEGNVFFLQDSDLKGKKFTEYKKYNPQWQGDIMGHGAIEYFYPKLENLQDKECTDFSTLDNFPKELVEVIKTGELTKFGCSLDLLNTAGQKEYQKIKQPALSKYQKIKQSAWSKYQEIEQPDWSKYQEIEQSAWFKYQKIKQSAWSKYQEIEQPDWSKYQKIKQSAWSKYQKIKQSAWSKYQEIEQPDWSKYQEIEQSAWFKYQKIKQSALWKLFKMKKYKNPRWK